MRSKHNMSASLIAGLDIHKKSTYATIIDREGKIIEKRKIKNDDIIDFLKRYDIESIAMESSNTIMPIYKILKDNYNVLVSHPKKTRFIAEAKIKNDKVDSYILAELTRLNALPLSYMPDDYTLMLREKVRRRAFLVRLRTKIKNRVRSYLMINGIKEPTYGLFSNKGKEYLRSLNIDAIDKEIKRLFSYPKISSHHQ
ncbi:MAG: hypothetical protein KatS3mg003_0666 [Candidatus Nitrosocaldaceae archaeon]|nr:MAG: hypothetical protein KatS3mg003_0666 [Candidatus Nitrosocaldaceae archaeon]